MSNLVRRHSDRAGLTIKEGPGALPVSSLLAPLSNGQTADANSVITAALCTGGLYVRSGQTAGRTDTTDTGVNLDTYFTSQSANALNNAFTGAIVELGVGESFELRVSNQAAQILTIAGGVGVTVTSTKTTIAASGSGTLIFTKTGVGTYNLFLI